MNRMARCVSINSMFYGNIWTCLACERAIYAFIIISIIMKIKMK